MFPSFINIDFCNDFMRTLVTYSKFTVLMFTVLYIPNVYRSPGKISTPMKTFGKEATLVKNSD